MNTSPTSIALRVIAELNARDLLPLVRDVCRAHGVTLDELCGTIRSQSVSRARHEAWWRLRHHPERHYSWGDLARIFARCTGSIRDGVDAHARRLTALSAPKSPHD